MCAADRNRATVRGCHFDTLQNGGRVALEQILTVLPMMRNAVCKVQLGDRVPVTATFKSVVS